jgi:hypothetical protein
MSSIVYQKESREILNSFLDKASKYEKQEIVTLANGWDKVSNHLEGLLSDLSNLDVKTADQLYKEKKYQQFLVESKNQVDKFSKLSNVVIEDGQAKFLELGLASSQKAIGLVTVNFNKLNISAVNNMIGLTSQGSKLETLLAASYPKSIEKLKSTLINASGLGYSPVKTAKLLSADMGGNLSRALTISRTETMFCFRQSSVDQMESSGVVNGLIRVEQSDCCDECEPYNDQQYSFDDADNLDFHPNCRGCFVPDI